MKKMGLGGAPANTGPPRSIFVSDRRNRTEKKQADGDIAFEWLWRILELAYELGWTEEALVKTGLVPEPWYRWALHGENGVLSRLGLVLDPGPGSAGRLAYPDDPDKALAVLGREWLRWNGKGGYVNDENGDHRTASGVARPSPSEVGEGT